VHKTTITNRGQRNNLDPVSANPFPGANINVENTFRWKRVKFSLDDRFKF